MCAGNLKNEKLDICNVASKEPRKVSLPHYANTAYTHFHVKGRENVNDIAAFC